MVFGGNGNGGDADTNLHLYESKSNEWTVRRRHHPPATHLGPAPCHPHPLRAPRVPRDSPQVLDVSRSDRVPPATTGHQLLAVQQRLPVYTFVTDRPTVAAPARGASGSGDGGPPTQITTSTSITRSVVDVSVASVTAGSRAGDASTGAGAGAGAGSTTTGFRSADTDIVLHTEEAAPAEEAPPAPRKPWKPPVRAPPLPQPSELGRLQPVAKSQGPLLVFGGRCTGKPAGVWSVSTRIRVAGESEEEAEASSKHVYGNGDVYYGDWERDMRHGSGRVRVNRACSPFVHDCCPLPSRPLCCVAWCVSCLTSTVTSLSLRLARSVSTRMVASTWGSGSMTRGQARARSRRQTAQCTRASGLRTNGRGTGGWKSAAPR